MLWVWLLKAQDFGKLPGRLECAAEFENHKGGQGDPGSHREKDTRE